MNSQNFRPTALRTPCMLERINREIKSGTRVANLFPNHASLLRLVSAVLIKVSKDWTTEKPYLRKENSSLSTQTECIYGIKAASPVSASLQQRKILSIA